MTQLDKVRPAVVMTRDPMGGLLNAVLVAPLTTRARGLAVEVRLGPADGVRHSSVANLDSLLRVDRSLLIRRVGRVRVATLTALCEALAIAVDCA